MKKILLFTAVLAALLSAASCQKEEMGAVEAGNGNVTFTIQTPEDAVTKAIGDGTNVDIVYYEIYKANNQQPVGEPLVDDTVEMSNKAASLTLNLLEDQEYVALFWAQVDGKGYYDVENLLKVEALYPNTKSNLEERAAFYQKFVFSTENAVNETVTLVRPFAQINIGTTLESLDMDYEVDVTASSVTVANPARFFNVNNGVGHTLTTQAVVFGEETDPQEALYVNNKEYEYVAMNYILVNGERSTVNVDFSIVTDKGTVTKTVADVPVAQNYRTNLLGNLLTKETKIEIVVDERFNTPDLEPDPLYMAAAIGGEYTLTENVTLSEPLKVESSLVLDLNGHTITADLKQEGRHHYAIDNYGNLTLKGEGSIEGRGVENFGTMLIEGDITITNLDTNGGSAIWNEGDLVINGGTFTTNSAAGEGSYGSALNTQANGTAVINGGNFIANSQLTYAILNYGETVINNATVKAKHGAVGAAEGDIKTVINGGTFSLMENPGVSDHCLYYVSDIKGGTFTLGNNTDSGAQVFCESTIAEGYKAVQDGNYWFVTEDTAIIVTPETLSSTDFNQSATFMMVGDFSSVPAIGITPTEGVNATVDASRATFGNRFKFNIPAVPDNANVVSRDNDRKGNYTLTNFNGTTLNLGAYGTSVVITNSTLDCIDVYAANISLDINGNTINSGYQMHPRTTDGETTDYAAYLNMMAYDLKFDNNNVSNAIGHAVAINGLKATFGTPVNSANEVKSFTGNTITGIAGSTKDKRAGFKVWDDLTYAHNGEKTFYELPAAGQQLITTIENDPTNVFEKAEGTSNTAYMINFHEYYHNVL